MEYLLGSVITIIVLLVTKVILSKKLVPEKITSLRYSQSSLFDIVKPFMDLSKIRKQLNSQAATHYAKQHVRVIIADSKAYWILDNTFYEADEVNGFIDKESAKPVDTMALDKVQLNKMMYIVEKLTEGVKDENRNSGN